MGGVVPVHAAPHDISTFAGGPDFGDGGLAADALVGLPQDVAVGPGGDLFIADTGNHRIRRIDTAGTITTVAGDGTTGFAGDGGPAVSARLRSPRGVWVDGSGNLYIADTGNHRVRMVDTAGTIATIAGTGTSGYLGDGGAATSANLTSPSDVTTDAAGNVYIADTGNHRVRRVDASGGISLYAGNGIGGYTSDSEGGPATTAWLNGPAGLAPGPSGELYISSTISNRVMRVTAAGVISTYAGRGANEFSGDGGSATLAGIDDPVGLATDAVGNLYIADKNNIRVRRVSASGTITTYAGNGVEGFSGDGGSAPSAAFDDPSGVAVGTSSVYVADTENHRIRAVDTSQDVSTIAGNGQYTGDGGPAANAGLYRPNGVAVDSAGNVYIADTENHVVRRVSGGIITTVAGTGTAGFSGDGGDGTSAQLNLPHDVTVDAAGNVFIADTANHRVRKVDPAGTITTFAGTGAVGSGGDGGAASLAQLERPTGLEVDADGNVYIADMWEHRVRRVDASGIIATFAGGGTPGSCGDGGPSADSCLDNPSDVATDPSGNVYIAELGGHRVRKVDVSGIITRIAGTSTPSNTGDDGPATSAAIAFPTGVEADGAGNVFITTPRDGFGLGGRVRMVDAFGTITTVAGTGVYGFSGDGGPAVLGQMAAPARIALDAEGDLYVADVFNNRIRMVESLGQLPAPILAGSTPASPSNLNSALIRGTAEPATTVRLYTDAACAGPVAASGTDAAFASPGLSVTVPDDTTTAFYATATNASGSVSECSPDPLLYVEDSTGPTITIDSSPLSPGNDRSPSWSFSAEAGSTTECELVRGSTVVSPFAPCISPAVYDLSGDPDGDYTFRVRAVDAAGNVALSDTGFEGTVGSTTCGTTSSTVTVGSGGVPAGTTLIVRLGLRDPQVGAVAATDSAGNTYTIDANAGTSQVRMVLLHAFVGTGLAPGDTIRVSHPSSGASGLVVGRFSGVHAGDAVDAAGTATGIGFTPNPTLTSTTDRGLLYAGVVSFNQRAFTEATGWTTHVHQLSGCGGAPGQSTNHGATRVVDAGTFTYGPTISHAEPWAGAIVAYRPAPYAASSFTLDGTLPAEPVITDGPDDPTNDTSPTWTFTAEPGSTTECELVGVSALAPCTSPVTYDLDGEPDGEYTFRVQARDGAGNVGSPAVATFVLDTTDPAAPTIESGPSSPGNVTGPGWTFTVEPGATPECQLSGVDAFAPCASPASYDLSGEPDGSYTFAVRAVDAAGNRSASSTGTYELDTTPPEVSFTAEPSSPDDARDPRWAFTSEPGASLECELSDAGGVVDPSAPCSSPATYDLPGRADGPYTLAVHATDAVGNVGVAATSTYVLDTTAPSVTFTSGPAAVSSDATPTWDVATEPGASLQCELTSGPVVIDPSTSCASPVSYDLSGEADGPYTLAVRATDAAGNTGAPASAAYTLDRAGPDVDVTGQPATPAASRSPSWSFTTEPGATTQCELLGPGGVVSAPAACTSPATYDLTGQPDGGFTFTVRATDAAGNVGAPAGGTYTLDTTAPDAPAITAAPSSPDNGAAPAWGFTAEPGAVTECQLTRSGAVVSGFSPCTSPQSYDLGGLPDGDYTFHVRATDPAGNVGDPATSDYTLDTTAPTVSFTSEPSSPGNDPSPEWGFDTEPGASTECRLSDAGGVVQAYAPCVTPAMFDLTGRPDGPYTLDVRATDAVGNTGPSAGSTYALDMTPPVVTLVDAPQSPGNSLAPEWAFTADPGATIECRFSGGSWSACDSPQAYDLTGRPDDAYTFEVRATDAAGNTGPATADTYTLDTTPPGAPTLDAVPASPGRDTDPTWSFSAEPGTEVECEFVLDGTAQPFTVCSSPQTLDLAGQPDGDYTIRVRAIDAAGNASAPAAHTYTLDTAGPAAAIVAAPSSPGSTRTPTWSFTVEAGATAECELVGGTPAGGWGACVSPTAHDLTGQVDGGYTFRVRGTDAAGNTGPVAASTYLLDTSGPVVTIVSGPPAVGADLTPTWAFTTESGASTRCELSSGAAVVRPLAACASPASFDLRGMPDGDYTFRVQASDQAGNSGPFASAAYALVPNDGGSGGGGGGTGGGGGGGTGGGGGGGSDDGGAPPAPDPATEEPVVDIPEPTSEIVEPGPASRGRDRNRPDPGGREEPSGATAEPEGTPSAASAPVPAPDGARSALDRFLRGAREVLESVLRQPGFPVSLLLVVFLFLLVQNRIDRRDPKLALAPVYPDPHLDFEPVPARGSIGRSPEPKT